VGRSSDACEIQGAYSADITPDRIQSIFIDNYKMSEVSVVSMASDAIRLYIYCIEFSEPEMEEAYELIENHGFSIYDSYEGFEGEITYLTQAFSPNEENLAEVDRLESIFRSQCTEREIERDEKNGSQQAPGIQGVSYVTGITIKPR
jgi:hypothetical protein